MTHVTEWEDENYIYTKYTVSPTQILETRRGKPGRELHGPWIPSEVQHRRKLISLLQHMNELHCELCGVWMAWTYEGDLNGSSFLCKGCFRELAKESK